MMKTTVVLSVCIATFAGCAHQEPAQSPEAVATPPSEVHASPGYAAGGKGAAEAMPERASASTAGPAAAPAGSPVTAPAPAIPVQPTPVPWSDGRILQVILSADQGEIAQARLARTRATDARVKRFAAMMIKDHTMADEEAQRAARRSGATFEASPTSQHVESDLRGSEGALEGQTGTDFDRAYVGTQIAEYQAQLGTIDDDLMPNAQSADVKKMLTKVRGKVLVHLEHAQDIFAALTR